MIQAKHVESFSWPGGVKPEGLLYVDDLPSDAKIWLDENAPGYDEFLNFLADITFNPKYKDLGEGSTS